MPTDNPVVEIFKGIEVKRYNRIVISVDEKTFKEIITLQETGLSSRKILGYSSTPCKHCEKIDVIAYDRDDNEVKIKRGILSKRIPTTHCGKNKIEHNAKSDRVK